MSFWTDLPVILQWWVIILLIGWAGWPIATRIFGEWEDRGYVFAKIMGLALVSWLVLVLASLKLVTFSWISTVVMAIGLGAGGWLARHKGVKISWKVVVVEEIVFLGALLLWSWVKAHAPEINGLEKFMDFGFMKSILRADYFPPLDMWFSQKLINYYYFGHLMTAVLTRLSGLDLGYTFNLMLATIFAWSVSMSLVIGKKLLAGLGRGWAIGGAISIAFLVSLSGNLQTIYAFSKGYAGNEDNPPPFWKIMVNPLDGDRLKQSWEGYWYPNATRFIPFTIHEFPGYSFVVSDVHGHVLSIPLVLLAIAMLVNMYGSERKKIPLAEYGAYGAVAGAMFMTNALDGPIYLGLFGILQIVREFKNQKSKIKTIIQNSKILFKDLGIVIAAFIITVLPFVKHFEPFVSGVALNCPPAFLAYRPVPGAEEGLRKIGPLVFEGVEKCQRSPLWMMLILWGFFLYCGLGLIKNINSPEKKMFAVWGGYCLGLILFAEVFYFKDIYPLHFRSNTMFKLGYQVFILMSFVSGYMIVGAIKNKRKWFVLGVLPLIFLVSIYPYFGVKSYFGNLKTYYGVYGLDWLEERRADDRAAIKWLEANVAEQPVILEANGDSYTDYDRVSVFTGLPTVAGWTVHEWLWRGSYGPIAERAEEVRQVYEGLDPAAVKVILDKYKVKYIIVGQLEREKYPNLNDDLISSLGQQVFRQDTTVVYKVN